MRGLPTILPITKQVVGNGHLPTDLDGKNKKALYLQAKNRAFKTFMGG
jgi:hypothetical protein